MCRKGGKWGYQSAEGSRVTGKRFSGGEGGGQRCVSYGGAKHSNSLETDAKFFNPGSLQEIGAKMSTNIFA